MTECSQLARTSAYVRFRLSWLLLVASASLAHAHATLSRASPSDGSTLSTAPQEVTLTFTETLEPAFSKLTVTDANGAEVSQGWTQVDEAIMHVRLKPLSPGIYRVNWRAVSSDTHKMEGSFTFRVMPQ
jgi:copper resistance protein C